jgi:mannose-6-phosphate isomerase-like protein (cupin superfamily)
MSADDEAERIGFMVGAGEGAAFWFLDTLTTVKVDSAASAGRLNILDHRMPAGFAPPPHVHEVSDETFIVLEGEMDVFCGDQAWRAGPGSMVYLPSGRPHGFRVGDGGPVRAIIVLNPGGFDRFVAVAGRPARGPWLPEPVPPDPVTFARLAAAHGIRILPPPGSLAARPLGLLAPRVRPAYRVKTSALMLAFQRPRLCGAR